MTMLGRRISRHFSRNAATISSSRFAVFVCVAVSRPVACFSGALSLWAILFACSLAASVFSSCGSSRAREFALQSAFLPEDSLQQQKPFYITGKKPIDLVEDPDGLILDVWKVESEDYPDEVRVFARVLDSAGNFISGMADPYYKGEGSYKRYWTGITQILGGDTVKVADYTVREYGDLDSIAYSVVLALDHGGSMADVISYLLEAARLFVSMKYPDDQIAIEKFDRKVVIAPGLTKNLRALDSALAHKDLTGFGLYTALYDAMGESVNVLKSAPSQTPRALVVFTDGEDNASKMNDAELYALARAHNVRIFPIGFGYVNDSTLKALADYTGGTYYRVRSKSEFQAVFKDIYESLRNFYKITYSATPFTGRSRVKIALNARGDGYLGFDDDGFNKDGFDFEGFDRDGFDFNGFDRDGFDRDGFDFNGFDRDGFDRNGFDKNGAHKNGSRFDKDGFDRNGFDRKGFNRDGFDKDGYGRDGFNKDGFNRKGQTRPSTARGNSGRNNSGNINSGNKSGNNNSGNNNAGNSNFGNNNSGDNNSGNANSGNNSSTSPYDRAGFDKDGFDKNGFDRNGFDRNGFDQSGFDKDGNHKNGSRFGNDGFDWRGFDKDGFDRRGFDKDGNHKNGSRFDGDGFDWRGFDKDGFDRRGFDANGRNRAGFDKSGAHANGSRFDGDGFDRNGFDKDGFGRDGFNRNGFDRDGFDRNGLDKNGKRRRGREITATFELDKSPFTMFDTLNTVFSTTKIYFDYRKAEVRPESAPMLDAIATAMLAAPKIKIEVRGHTDNIGGEEFNQRLSELRAAAVVNALVERGVSASRLRSKGFGLSQPVAGNDSEEDRQKNRRTEFAIIAR
jgi:outer membrane protein OmpA-like peptidoglycan-associated protein